MCSLPAWQLHQALQAIQLPVSGPVCDSIFKLQSEQQAGLGPASLQMHHGQLVWTWHSRAEHAPHHPVSVQVTIVTRRAEDELLLLASDGLWDVLSNQVQSKVSVLLWHRLL